MSEIEQLRAELARLNELERMIAALEVSRINFIARYETEVRLIDTDCGAMNVIGRGQTLQFALLDAAERLKVPPALSSTPASDPVAEAANARTREIAKYILQISGSWGAWVENAIEKRYPEAFAEVKR